MSDVNTVSVRLVYVFELTTVAGKLFQVTKRREEGSGMRLAGLKDASC